VHIKHVRERIRKVIKDKTIYTAEDMFNDNPRTAVELARDHKIDLIAEIIEMLSEHQQERKTLCLGEDVHLSKMQTRTFEDYCYAVLGE
jgi:hypothetical protein